MTGDVSTSGTVNYGYPYTSGGTTLSYGYSLAKIEALLERIAVALENADWANKPDPLCAACGEPTKFGTKAPFDSDHDDELVCGKCINKLFKE